MSLFFNLFELAANFMEAWLCYHFVQLFVPNKTSGKFSFLILSLLLIITMQLGEWLELFPLIITLWFVFYICVTTVIVFQVDVFYAVSLVSFYILCGYIIDFFCMSIMGVLGRDQQFAQTVISHLSLWRCWYLVVDKLLFLLFFILVRKASQKKLFYNARIMFTVSLLDSCKTEESQ